MAKKRPDSKSKRSISRVSYYYLPLKVTFKEQGPAIVGIFEYMSFQENNKHYTASSNSTFSIEVGQDTGRIHEISYVPGEYSIFLNLVEAYSKFEGKPSHLSEAKGYLRFIEKTIKDYTSTNPKQ